MTPGKFPLHPSTFTSSAAKAEQLGITQVGDILVICGEKHRVLHFADLYEIKNKRRTAFKGEQAFTAAILDVSSAGQKKIYFLSGHGEQEPDEVDPVHGLSALGDELRNRNFDVRLLDLTVTKDSRGRRAAHCRRPPGRL